MKKQITRLTDDFIGNSGIQIQTIRRLRDSGGFAIETITIHSSIGEQEMYLTAKEFQELSEMTKKVIEELCI